MGLAAFNKMRREQAKWLSIEAEKPVQVQPKKAELEPTRFQKWLSSFLKKN